MRCIVMSDSHGKVESLRNIIEAYHTTAELFIFLGDGVRDFEEASLGYPENAFIAVKGNNDWDSKEDKIKEIVIEGKRIYITHGDMHQVKVGLSMLVRAAQDHKVDVALYGHTHRSAYDFIDGIHFINPGSVRDSYITPKGYLILDITEDGIKHEIMPMSSLMFI